MKRSVARVPALERGLELLDWMASQDEPVTLTQVARGMGLGIPEVQRPVACLEEIGYLRRLASGSYELSGKLFALASHQSRLVRLRRAAEPALMEFARQTGHSMHLSVPDGDAALMILDVPGEGLVRLSLRPGARFEPQSTLSGNLLAAAGAIVCPARFKVPASLQKAANAGRAVSQESQQAEGVIDVGIVLRNPEGRVLGALTCSAIRSKSEKIRSSGLCAIVQKTALKISASY